MKWSEAYATGIERIDEQHRMLFKMSEDYRSALDEGQGKRTYASLLESLDLYAQSHFRLEEGCMDRCRCPVGQSNRDAHAGFVELLRRFRERFAAKGFDADDAVTLTDTIDSWLADHICRLDVQLRGYVNTPDGTKEPSPGSAE